MLKPLIASLVLFGVFGAAAADLSSYRGFQFGASLADVAKRAGVSPSQVKVVHQRPELIQTLKWRPQPLGRSSNAEPVQQVLFSFYGGALYGIDVEYDQYQTKGLTNDDIVEAISASYGAADRSAEVIKTMQGPYGENEDVLARWQDSQYCYELVHLPFGPTFKLIGVSKKLQAAAEAASVEAKRLDEQDAPSREAARLASEQEGAKATPEKARLLNKPNFRP